MPTPLKILLASPRGFCAGVERAIEIVEKAVEIYGPPVYVRHEIVHNAWVVENLRAKGVIFVTDLEEIPDGAVTVFSAHGTPERVEHEARLRALPVIDATCPLVTKVHNEAQRYEKEGREIIMIGHAGHPEVEGTTGRVKGKVYLVSSSQDVESLQVSDPGKLAYVTQTTLSVDDTKDIIAALKKKFPDIAGPELRDICYATQNRQNAVRAMQGKIDLLLVVGAKNSSNSNRLRDLGEEMGIPSHLIASAENIDPTWVESARSIGLSAGASAPEHLVQGVVDRLREFGDVQVETLVTVDENVRFKLPPEITRQSLKSA